MSKATYGPGFFRMKKQLGHFQMEALRQDVLARQVAARKAVSGERVTGRERVFYQEHPVPTPPKRRKK
jgi:hypothetical protein